MYRCANMLTLRVATQRDVAVIRRLIQSLAEYEKLAHEARADETQLATALFGATPRVFCELADWASPAEPVRTVGFALWFYSFSTFRGAHGLYLEDLFVEPDFRGRGVGRALLQRLARRCVDEQLGRLEWAVLDWNAPARRFYESVDARPMTEWIVHRVSDEALQRLARDR
jgi:GNAT superfamily N-acetyltransferase